MSEGEKIFTHALVYLGAALVVVPVARRLGLGSVLGYLVGGVLIGPYVLDLVGDAGTDVLHFAEFGVVMMIFLVGLELEPERLWRLRGTLLGLGGAQVGGSAVAVGSLAMVAGLPPIQAATVGLIAAMSSTAIAVQQLSEKGWMKSDAGQRAFAVLLFQDLAVIPMLALFPWMAGATEDGGHGSAHPLATLGAVAAVVVLGRLGVPPLMRAVASSGLRELFTAAALALVIGVTVLMGLVGLSPALGAFLAGVVLANSEYRHELESDIEPFKGLLLGLFFLSVGAGIDFAAVAANPFAVFGALVAVLAVKGLVLFGLGRAAGMARDQALILGVSLAQVGEFAFLLLGFTSALGLLPAAVVAPLMAVTALSMAAGPLLVTVAERWILPRWVATRTTREHDVEDEGAQVIVAGYGRFGQIAARLLRATGHRVTLLDVDNEQIEIMKRFGARVFYGDAGRLDLLRAAGAERARVLLVAVDDPAKALEIVRVARTHFPDLALLVRARGRVDAMELVATGVEGAYRETMDSALRAGTDALRLLGMPAHQAERMARTFRRHDERAMRDLAALRHDTGALQATARERIRLLEQVLADDASTTVPDDGWDADAIRTGQNRIT